MLVSLLRYPITSLGPGKRVALFTRGCDHRCPGCIIPDWWSFDPSKEKSVPDLLKEIQIIAPGEKAITLSGGDPFEQKDLLPLLRGLRELGYNDILVYTGFTLEEIESDPEKKACLAYLDVLIDGPYLEKENDNRPLRGSANQRLILFTPALEKSYATALAAPERSYDLIQEGESYRLIGIAPKGFQASFIPSMGRKGVNVAPEKNK
jgi:anaerobic ribonucleoside-triphosphate reductase activating protein